MTSATMTAIKMLESLPEAIQERIADRLRAIVEEECEEARWTHLLGDTKKLKTLAQQAKAAINAKTPHSSP